MKQIVIALGLLSASTTIGSAADLPARIYTKAPAAWVYDWTGFYIGVNAGVGVSRDPTSIVLPGPPDVGTSSIVGGAGAMGGGQLGYNWQSGNWVLGLEADIQASGVKDDRTCVLNCSQFQSDIYHQKLDWFGTARGRIGFAAGDVLSYFTGGFAYGHVDTGNMLTVALPFPFGEDRVQSGWTIGSGVEASLGGNWTGKVEYLYLNLGSQAANRLLLGISNGVLSSDIREHIFRAGLNYRFGQNGASRVEPIADWRGLYAGGNAGGVTALNRSSSSVVISPFSVQEKYNASPRGFIGGVQAGYNWQTAFLVYGLEADIQGSTQRENAACLLICEQGALVIAPEQKMSWLGTVRGRLGYAAGSSLFYATGGLAYGDLMTHVSETISTNLPEQNFSNTLTGYTVGAGIETLFNPFGLFGRGWSAKTEYLYVDLGSVTDAYNISGISHSFSTHVQEHVFRTGLNYHFAGN